MLKSSATGKSGEPDVGDVHEGVEARARRRDDEAAEGGEVVRAGVARDIAVVVPWNGTSSSAGMPIAEP